VTLRLAGDWLWDFWFAADGDAAHLFYLHAPRSLGDPNTRHWHARIGHAVSHDLRTWELLPEALGPGPRGAFDDRATWTGSVIRRDGRWLMFYTGLSHADDGWLQRIGLATSDDLTTWTRTPLRLESDARWYEKASRGGEEHWRDPWAFEGADGAVHLLITARAASGAPDGRGVLGHAWSHDLETWTVGPPLSAAGDFRQVEVPQLFEMGGRWYVLVSAGPGDHSAARRAAPGFVAEGGSHLLVGDGPLGPFRALPGRMLVGDARWSLYAGRLIEWRGAWQFMAWRNVGPDGQFVGELADPMPVTCTADGTLRVDVAASLAERAP
jgi:beta-fructofuranosidase